MYIFIFLAAALVGSVVAPSEKKILHRIKELLAAILVLATIAAALIFLSFFIKMK